MENSFRNIIVFHLICFIVTTGFFIEESINDALFW